MGWSAHALLVVGAGVSVGGCGRLAFETVVDGGTNGDGRDALAIDVPGTANGLRLNLTFESSFADVAEARRVNCDATCPTFTAGRTGGGLAGQFNGGECLLVDDDPDLYTQVFTVAVWLRLTFGVDASMFTKPYTSDTTGDNSWELWSNSSNGLRFDTTPSVSLSGGNVATGVWHHVAATFENGQTAIYVDGAFQAGGTSVATSYSTDVIRIGCDRDVGVVTSFFKGDLDDVRFYDRVLSSTEIATLAQ